MHLALSGFLYVLACLSKELAIALPLLLILLPSQDAGAPAEVRPRRRIVEPAWVLTFMPAAVFVLLIRQAALSDELGHAGLLTQLRGSLLVQEPLVAVSALTRMLRSLLVPWPHSALITRSDVGFDAVTLVSVAALAALTAISFRAYPRAVAFAASWIAAFAVPSLLVPGGGVIVAAERYAYVPSVGAAMILGALAASRGALRGFAPNTRRAAAGVVTLGLAAAAFGRTPVWANDDTLSTDLVMTSPRAALAHQIRAEVLLGTSRLDQAITSYRRAASLDPRSAPLHHSLGRTLLRAGDAAGAVSAFKRAVDIEPDWAEPRVGLAVACATTGDWPCVEEQRRALVLYPEDLARLDRIIGRSGR
jgi:tetratricopeptide (TPR) repeat protein